jgi:hypothetical protein
MRQAINPMPLEDAEYQHTYLVPTQEITFNQAILKNTDWSGTCLNAVNSMNGRVETRLNFEGADLSGANFIDAWLLHPVTKEHLGMGAVVHEVVTPVEQLNPEAKDKQKVLLEHVAGIFGNSLEKANPPVKTIVDEAKQKAFKTSVLEYLESKRGK